jgi:cytochrome c oxidase accessory protein FixG
MENKSLYKSKKKFYSDPVAGKFNNIRLTTMSMVVIIYFLLPWININEHQAFLFDIMYNRLYFLGNIFFPHDFVLISLSFIILIILLFFITLYSGRIWCGFLCPQSIWIKITEFFNRFIEGNRIKRMKFDNISWSKNKILKKFLKHSIIIIFSFLTSITFIGYFIPIKTIILNFCYLDLFRTSVFWIFFFTLLTYFNVTWFKEQFCFLVCPYARLQSVMFDINTLIVSYDRKRGEKRGSRHKNYDYKNHGLGDCIDCKQCVFCCPTGIDIRDGLQMECISCGACIDACNLIMDKMGYKRGLIDFKKENVLLNNINTVSKNKLIAYFITIVLFVSIFSYNLYNRSLIQLNINRGQMQLYNLTKNNCIENFYFIKITNKSNRSNIYSVSINPDFLNYSGKDIVFLSPGESICLDIKLYTEISYIKDIYTEINFKVNCLNDSKIKSVNKKTKFISPN